MSELNCTEKHYYWYSNCQLEYQYYLINRNLLEPQASHSPLTASLLSPILPNPTPIHLSPYPSHLFLVISSQNSNLMESTALFTSPNFLYSVYLPQCYQLNFPSVSSLAFLPFLSFVNNDKY